VTFEKWCKDAGLALACEGGSVALEDGRPEFARGRGVSPKRVMVRDRRLAAVTALLSANRSRAAHMAMHALKHGVTTRTARSTM